MLQRLLALRERTVHYVAETRPAVYFIADREAQGVLVNTPAFDADLLAALNRLAPLKYLFYPSRRGARDVECWRAASNAKSLACPSEAATIEGVIDLAVARDRKLTRTIDFLTMSGVTAGSCALRIGTDGGVVFFGPILEPGDDGWPSLILHADDHSSENRVLGVLGLQDLHFAYAFTDVFEPGRTRFGPAADVAVAERLRRALES